MPLPLIPVALSMGTLAAAFAFGRKSDKSAEMVAKTAEQKTAAKTAAKAAEKHDWQNASVEAIISRDDETIRLVARKMLNAGKIDESKSLLASAKEMKAPKGKPAAKTAPKHVSSHATKAAAQPKKKLPASLSPEQKQAVELAAHLRGTVRYKENTAMVSAYQKAHNLTPDGKYGPGTARTLWAIFKIVPPNPYYWPKANTEAALSQYRKFLDSIAAENSKHAETVKALKANLGR